MPKNQRGFETIKVLVILVLIAAAGSIVWYVAKYGDKAATQTASVAKADGGASGVKCTPVSSAGGSTYTDQQIGYCVSLPKDWQYLAGQAMKDDAGKAVKDSNGKAVVAADSIQPKSNPAGTLDGLAEVITDTSKLSAKEYFEQKGEARATYKSGDGVESTINGYQAYTANIGSPASAKVVTISHGGKIVEFFYYTDASLNTSASICQQIISSIKFIT